MWLRFLPTLPILTLSTLTKCELTKWESTKWEVDKVGRWVMYIYLRTPDWMMNIFFYFMRFGVYLSRRETAVDLPSFQSLKVIPLLQQASEVPNIASNTRRDWYIFLVLHTTSHFVNSHLASIDKVWIDKVGNWRSGIDEVVQRKPCPQLCHEAPLQVDEHWLHILKNGLVSCCALMLVLVRNSSCGTEIITA